ncbi:MAG: hypothetical protein EOM50_01715 [Erysipelotrichia bacterium]|nr:hypothetical protein [Erysipelotrichia bacterium]
MIDRYKMIIWAKPKEETLEEQITNTNKILNTLKRYDLFDTLFLPAKSKKEVKIFEISNENIKKLILQKKDKVVCNIGSELSFSTSLNEETSLNIKFSVGNSNCNLTKAIVISLPVNITSNKLKECAGLLKDLAETYDAFYACLTSNFNLRLYDNWYDNHNKTPKTVFWINYWGKDIVKKLKVNEKMLAKVYEYEQSDEGYYIRLQKEPFDTLNEEHVKLQKEINDLFGI